MNSYPGIEIPGYGIAINTNPAGVTDFFYELGMDCRQLHSVVPTALDLINCCHSRVETLGYEICRASGSKKPEQ